MAKVSLIFSATLLFFMLAITANAQHLYDTTHIKKHYDKSLWSLVNNSMQYRYQLAPAKTEYLEKGFLDFTQQSWLEYGISYAKNNQRWYLSLFKIPGVDTAGKGSGDFYHGSYSVADKNYLFDFKISYGKGFYDENVKNYQSYFDSTNRYLNQPDMTHFMIKTSYWSFKNYKKFSYNAAYQYVQQQKKSAGSLFYMGELSYLYTKNKKGIIPNYAVPYYNDFKKILVQNKPEVIMGGGITGTLVIKEVFFVNGLAMLRSGINYNIYSSKEKAFEKSYLQPVYGAEMRASIGINTEKFVVAYNTKYTADFSNNKDITNGSMFLLGSLYLGYRFNKSE